MRLIRAIATGVVWCALATMAGAQQVVTYQLTYGGDGRVVVEMTGPPSPAPHTFVMPRAVPMGYGQRPYDQFVGDIKAESFGAMPTTVVREEGPRWRVGHAGGNVQSVRYEVNVLAMEAAILAGGDSSRAREDYLFVLGYSVFGYIEGFESAAVRLEIVGPANWPVFTTLAPKSPPGKGLVTVTAANFYELADSQIVMGSGVRIERVETSVAAPLFVVTREELEIDRARVYAMAKESYERLAAYFGSVPYAHYTAIFEFLKPVTANHTYGFSMEHLESATFCLGKDRALAANSNEREVNFFRVNVAHHMAHAWIPKRAYGQGYFPFSWEVAPAHDSIWFSEGFGQYAAIDALADGLPEPQRAAQLERYIEARFRANLRQMPAFLLEMPLEQLSYRGSYVYSEDFRVGRTLFSRGGLMAAEMDARIREKTKGAKRLRDALRHLLAWSAKHQRGFEIRELPGIFEEATGVDVRDILQKWLGPMPKGSG